MQRFVTITAIFVMAIFGIFAEAQAEITEVGSLDIQDNDFNDVAIVSLTAFVASSNGGLYVVDVSHPAEPQLLERYEGACTGVEAVGDYAFAGFNTDDEGLRVFFIDSLVYSAEANVIGMLLEGNLLFVTEQVDSVNNILKIFDVANPAEPELLGQIRIGRRGAPFALLDGRLYLPRIGQDWNELNVIDVSNPEQPALIRLQIMGQGDIADMATDGRYVFVADQSRDGAVRVQDFVRHTFSVERAGIPQDLAIFERRLVVGSRMSEQDPTIRVFDIQHPGFLSLVDEYSTGRHAVGMTFDGQLGYVAENGVDENQPSRLLIINVEEAQPGRHDFVITDLLDVAGEQLAAGDSVVIVDADHQFFRHLASAVWSPGEPIVFSVPVVHDDPENGVERGHQFGFRIYDAEIGLYNQPNYFTVRDNSRGRFRSSGQTTLWLRENAENWNPPMPVHWPVISTGINHSLLIEAPDWIANFDEIAVFTPAGVMAGSGVHHRIHGDGLGLAAWGDDPTTNDTEGFINDEPFAFVIWDHLADEEYSVEHEIIQGEEAYTDNAFSILRLIPPEELENIIGLESGWNLVSSWLDPDNPDVLEIFSELAEDGRLVMVKDGRGRFYMPDENFNNIPAWDVVEGYQVKISDRNGANLPINGQEVGIDTPIQLRRGWNTVAYFPRDQVGIEEALNNLGGHVLFVKDGHGQFYLPQRNFSNMGALRRGQGYQIKVDEDIELIWNVPQQIRAVPGSQYLMHFPKAVSTGSNMSVLISGLKPGSEVGAFNGKGQLVGSGVADSQGRCGLGVWGDDETTETIDGLKNGEEFVLKVWTGGKELSIPKALKFEADGLEILEVDQKDLPFDRPIEFKLNEAFPNPFNSTTLIRFDLPATSLARLSVYDLTGREVTELFKGPLAGGTHSVTLNANDLPAGMYVVRLQSGELTTSRKILLVK